MGGCTIVPSMPPPPIPPRIGEDAVTGKPVAPPIANIGGRAMEEARGAGTLVPNTPMTLVELVPNAPITLADAIEVGCRLAGKAGAAEDEDGAINSREADENIRKKNKSRKNNKQIKGFKRKK